MKDDATNRDTYHEGEAILFAEYSNSVGELYYCKGTKCDKIDSDVSSVTRIGNSIWYLADYDSDENCYNAYIQKSGKENFLIKERKLETSISWECRCKNLQQNISKSNPTIH